MIENLVGFGINQLILLWGVVLFASILRSFTGFGFALAAVPIFSLFLSPSEAVVLSTLLAFLISVLSLRSYWGVVSLRPMIPMGIMLVIGTIIGTTILSLISKNQFQLVVGVSVLIACASLIYLKPSPSWKSPLFTWLTGLISGIMSGAAAISGPPMVIYAMITEPEPKRSRAWLMTILGFAALFALISFGIAGFVTAASIWQGILAFPALYIGNKIGTYLFERFGNDLYRKIALSVLFVIGVSTIARAILT